MVLKFGETEDRDWQRLDKWLWCARVLRARTDCADLAAQGSIRINRQPTDKAHAKLRVGDVLTIPVHGRVRVLRVAQLAVRRGPASEARLLYVDGDAADGDAPGRSERGGDTPGGDTPVRDAPGRDAPGGDTPGRDALGRDALGRDVRDVSATSCAATNSTAYRAP